jgi:hypothetical protein
MSVTFLKQLRDAAATCTKPQYKLMLKQAADHLDDCIGGLFTCPSTDNMIRLNSAWAYAQRVLSDVPDEGTPAPLAGARQSPRGSQHEDGHH